MTPPNNPMPKPKSLWPLGITCAALLYLGGVGMCSFLACTHKSELVSEKYYDQEIQYQARIDTAGRTHKLATSAIATYEDSTRHLWIALPAEHAGKTAQGEIELYRPSAAGQDQHFKLEADASGRQCLDVAALRQGFWKVRITWNVGGMDYFVDQKVAIGPASLQAKLTALDQHPYARLKP